MLLVVKSGSIHANVPCCHSTSKWSPLLLCVSQGAGFAGISFAEELDHAGVKDYWITEATQRLGGRMYGGRFGRDRNGNPNAFPIEYGANWIEGLTGNPIWEMALRYNLDGNIQYFDNLHVYDEQGQFNQSETNYSEGSNCARAVQAYVAMEQLSEFCLVQTNNTTSPSSHNKTVYEFCQTSMQTLSRHVDQNRQDNDLTCQQAQILTTGFYPPHEQNAAVARVCQWFTLDFDNADNPSRLSTMHTVPEDMFRFFEDANYYVKDQRGYKWLVERTALDFLNSTLTADATVDASSTDVRFNDPRLNLNTKVVKVEWDPRGLDDVRVTLCRTKAVVSPNLPVMYPCKEDEAYISVTAKFFVSTFSLGVLKASVDMSADVSHPEDLCLENMRDVAPIFDPPLISIPKLGSAIQAIGYVTFQKIFFQFPFRFWPKGVEVFLTAYSNGTWVGEFAPIWFSLDLGDESDPRYLPGSNILFLTVTGDRAVELSSRSDQAIIDDILPVLNLVFDSEIRAAHGGNHLSRDDVMGFFLYRWHADPLFRGTFSTDLFQAPTQLLGERYGNLIFSGEAYCNNLKGSVEGAYLSGKRSARRLLEQSFGIKRLDHRSLCDSSSDQLDWERERHGWERAMTELGMNFIPQHASPYPKGYPCPFRLSNHDVLDRRMRWESIFGDKVASDEL